MSVFFKVKDRFKLYVNLVSIYLSYWNRYIKGEVVHDRAKKTVFFDLTTKYIDRYYYALVYSFYTCGYNIYIKNRPGFISTWQGENTIFILPRVKVVNNTSNLVDVYISDYSKDGSSLDAKKRINVKFDVYSDRTVCGNSHYLLCPFPMSTFIYQNNYHKDINEFRSQKRKYAIFFSGNMNEDAYNKNIIKSFFGKLTRFEIIEILVNRLMENDILLVDDNDKLYSIYNSQNFINKFVFVKWAWPPVNSVQENVFIEQPNWLSTLSYSEFFLACPGVSIPLCHNIIESMSIGTIPIIEYPELFYPPLEHNVNCIVFNGEEDLLEKVKMVLRMSFDEKERLRNGVINYFDKYLSSDVIVESIENFPVDKFELYMNAEGKSISEYEKNNNIKIL